MALLLHILCGGDLRRFVRAAAGFVLPLLGLFVAGNVATHGELFRHLVTLETREPVAFFSYPDKPSQLKAPGTRVHGLAEPDEDSVLALEMLVDALGLGGTAPRLQERIETVGDAADLQEVYDTERHLLYVACTRARDDLLVTGVVPVSEFLDDLKKTNKDAATHE